MQHVYTHAHTQKYVYIYISRSYVYIYIYIKYENRLTSERLGIAHPKFLGFITAPLDPIHSAHSFLYKSPPVFILQLLHT